MLRKPWKTITTTGNNALRIYGNNHWIDLAYEIPEWGTELQPCFTYKGHLYFLDEFWNVHNSVHMPNAADWLKEFDGMMNDSAWTGVLIKLGKGENDDAVKAYTFNC